MWAVIVGIIIFIMGIVLVILGYNDDEDIALPVGIVAIICAVFMVVLSLAFGYSFNKEEYTKEKEQIEYLLENKIDLYVIEKAEKHNEDVVCGNNLWCRFTIDDREEYIIDINKYLTNKDLEK